jgi:hypothetical protein
MLGQVRKELADLLDDGGARAVEPDAAIRDPDGRGVKRLPFAWPFDTESVLDPKAGAMPLAFEKAAGFVDSPGVKSRREGTCGQELT